MATNKFQILGGYFSPVSDAYNKRGLATGVDRVRMCELALLESSDWLMVDPWESLQPQFQRTALVLDHFQSMVNGGCCSWGGGGGRGGWGCGVGFPDTFVIVIIIVVVSPAPSPSPSLLTHPNTIHWPTPTTPNHSTTQPSRIRRATASKSCCSRAATLSSPSRCPDCGPSRM